MTDKDNTKIMRGSSMDAKTDGSGGSNPPASQSLQGLREKIKDKFIMDILTTTDIDADTEPLYEILDKITSEVSNEVLGVVREKLQHDLKENKKHMNAYQRRQRDLEDNENYLRCQGIEAEIRSLLVVRLEESRG